MAAKRAVVTVAVGTRKDVGKPGEEGLLGQSFNAKLSRFADTFFRNSYAYVQYWDEWPSGSPTHEEVPYAFKAYALADLDVLGYTTVLWADVSVVPQQNISGLFDLIEQQGYWFSDNRDWNCGQWTCDAALPLLGITREQAFEIPQVAATAFGLDLRSEIGRKFLWEYLRYAKNGAFKGPWVNTHGEASADRRVLGHRHDQTAASVTAYRLGMKLTNQPDWFSDYRGCTDKTVLLVQR